MGERDNFIVANALAITLAIMERASPDNFQESNHRDTRKLLDEMGIDLGLRETIGREAKLLVSTLGANA